MKNQFGVIVLLLVCLVCAALGIALITGKKQSAEQKRVDTETITTLSNQWVDTSGKLEEQKKVAGALEQDLATQKKATGDLSNNLTEVSTALTNAQAAVKASEEAIRQRDGKITELETQNQALDRQALDLTASITNLTLQIAATERKLAASEGDRTFLEKELKRLMSDKSDLERQFNDLSVLRAQISKIKDELAAARRLEWSRNGTLASSDMKGATRLMQGFGAVQQPKPAAPKPNYDLNVEVTSEGKVQVITPLTNAPANPPAQ